MTIHSCFYCVNINHVLFTSGPNWITVTLSWPSGTVVKVLAYHAGGHGFEPPLEQFFYFLIKRFFFSFSSSFHIQTSFHFTSLFSYLHNLDVFFFFFFFLMLHVFSFLNLYKLTNSTITYFINYY